MSMARGRFIVLEGADGSGKSTQAARLVEFLRASGCDVLHVRDPGSTRLSEAVRAILLDPASGRLSVASETYLYMAARAQLVAEVVEPALAAGRVVVCERWTYSTEVYQGVAGKFGAANVRRVGRLAEGAAAPDLTIVLDVEVGAGLARLARAHDRMESKGAKFHADVVRAYRRLAKGRARCVLVPPGTLDEVTDRVRREVAALAA